LINRIDFHRLTPMNLIIVTEKDIIDSGHIRLNDNRAEHIRSILKSSIGDPIEIGLLNGGICTAHVEIINEREIILGFKEFTTLASTSETDIDIICALPRPQTLKKVLITSAMMGVRNLYLIRANRVEKSYFHSPLLEKSNYNRFLREGLSQGRLTRVPVVNIYTRFKPFFEDTLPDIEKTCQSKALKLLPDQEMRLNLVTVYKKPHKNIITAIGPEGGWVPFEIELMKNLGFKSFSLGNWTLRVENALTALMAQIELCSSLLKNK